MLAVIGSLQQLAVPLMLGSSGGGVARSMYLYMVHTYQQIFAFQRFGYGFALVWLLFGLIILLTLVVFRTSRYWVYYETELEGGRT